MAEIVYAARQAVLDVIDLMVATKDMTRSDAYALCSLQADLLVTQLVNGVNASTPACRRQSSTTERTSNDPAASRIGGHGECAE